MTIYILVCCCRHPMRLATTLEAVMASWNNRLPSDSVALRGTSFVGAPGVSLMCRPQLLQCGTALIPLHSLFSMLIVVLS